MSNCDWGRECDCSECREMEERQKIEDFNYEYSCDYCKAKISFATNTITRLITYNKQFRIKFCKSCYEKIKCRNKNIICINKYEDNEYNIENKSPCRNCVN